MQGCTLLALVGVVAMATAVAGRGWRVVATGRECNGAETYKGYKSSSGACAAACAGRSDMFVYGTNQFGVKRCSGGKCKCYCEDATKAVCRKVKKHKGYDLYRRGNGRYQRIAKGVECGGAEIYKGYKSSANSCSLACKGISRMFVYGTNRYGVKRCHKGKCACYCETATTSRCKKGIKHKGYNLYRFGGNARKSFGDEKPELEQA